VVGNFFTTLLQIAWRTTQHLFPRFNEVEPLVKILFTVRFWCGRKWIGFNWNCGRFDGRRY